MYDIIRIYNYPDHKPEKSQVYLIWGKAGMECNFALYNVDNDSWKLHGQIPVKNDCIVAWSDPYIGE
jgi:hypothetical protein